MDWICSEIYLRVSGPATPSSDKFVYSKRSEGGDHQNGMMNNRTFTCTPHRTTTALIVIMTTTTTTVTSTVGHSTHHMQFLSFLLKGSSGEGSCEQQLHMGSVILKDSGVPHTHSLPCVLKGSRLVKHPVIPGVRCLSSCF